MWVIICLERGPAYYRVASKLGWVDCSRPYLIFGSYRLGYEWAMRHLGEKCRWDVRPLGCKVVQAVGTAYKG